MATTAAPELPRVLPPVSKAVKRHHIKAAATADGIAASRERPPPTAPQAPPNVVNIALVAGPDPGHAFPVFALAQQFMDQGIPATIFTGEQWLDLGTSRGFTTQLLPGLAPLPEDNDQDAGEKLHERAGRMAELLAPLLRQGKYTVVVSDVITAGGSLAAELVGLPWIELSPHPLYQSSKYLPPMGSGLAPARTSFEKVRDIILRRLTAKAVKKGLAQRSVVRKKLGLSPVSDGPLAYFVATLPALELPRPDWPANAYLIGPQLWEPTLRHAQPPASQDPFVVLSPSTATVGALGENSEHIIDALSPQHLGRKINLFICSLNASPPAQQLPDWVQMGSVRQDELLAHAQLAIGGGGHGFLAKSLIAGVPSVLIPGGGDQWEMSARMARQGSAVVVRPANADNTARAVQQLLVEPSFTQAAVRARSSLEQCHNPVQLLQTLVGSINE